jgi:streptogramin lyase
VLLALAAGLATLALAAPAGAVTITEYQLPGGSTPRFITTGHDGRLWFPLEGAAQIGRLTSSGDLVGGISSDALPLDIIAGPAASMYWTARGAERVTRRTADGTTTYSSQATAPGTPGPPIDPTAIMATANGLVVWTLHLDTVAPDPPSDCGSDYTLTGISCVWGHGDSGPPWTDLSLAPDGSWWVAAHSQDAIRRIAPTGGAAVLIKSLAPGSNPYRITAGPDGNMWATLKGSSTIARITPAGVLTEFPLRAGTQPNDIVAGPDGALWFTEFGGGAGNKIGRMTTDGVLTNEFEVPTAFSQPFGITVGPDGNIWFTESAADKVARLTLDAPGTPGGGGPPLEDRVAPVFQGRVRLTPRTFRVARAATPVTAQNRRRSPAPAGTTIRFVLSEPARVRMSVQRRVIGRRVRGRCRKATKRNKGARRCPLWRTAGALRRGGLLGPNSVAFSGRIGRRALAVGAYHLRVTATDSAGNTSNPRTAGFSIVRPSRR